MTVEIDPRYHMDYVRGTREPELQAMLEKLLRHGDFFVDVGAHIGFFSLLAGSLVGSAGRVLALEPDPKNCEMLRTNVALNRLPQIEVHQRAAWSGDAWLEFKTSGTGSGRSEGRVLGENPPGARLDSVHGARLDDLVKEPPRLVKIDVEGAEVEVLAGAQRLLATGRTHWAVECHTADLAQVVGRIFEDHGYRAGRLASYDAGRGPWKQVFLTADPPNPATPRSS